MQPFFDRKSMHDLLKSIMDAAAEAEVSGQEDVCWGRYMQSKRPQTGREVFGGKECRAVT